MVGAAAGRVGDRQLPLRSKLWSWTSFSVRNTRADRLASSIIINRLVIDVKCEFNDFPMFQSSYIRLQIQKNVNPIVLHVLSG